MSEAPELFRFWDVSPQAAGWRVRLVRKAQPLSQLAFAEELGLTKDTVAKWEQGKALPTYEHLRRIAKRFQVTTDFIVIGDWSHLPGRSQDALAAQARAETPAAAPAEQNQG